MPSLFTSNLSEPAWQRARCSPPCHRCRPGSPWATLRRGRRGGTAGEGARGVASGAKTETRKRRRRAVAAERLVASISSATPWLWPPWPTPRRGRRGGTAADGRGGVERGAKTASPKEARKRRGERKPNVSRTQKKRKKPGGERKPNVSRTQPKPEKRMRV